MKLLHDDMFVWYYAIHSDISMFLIFTYTKQCFETTFVFQLKVYLLVKNNYNKLIIFL